MEIQGYNNYLIYPDGRIYSKKTNIYLKPRYHLGYQRIVLYNDKQKKW